MKRQFGSVMIKRFLIFSFILFAFSACNKEEKVLEKNIEEIEQYISDNNLNGVQKTESGLHYLVVATGDNNFPTLSDTVKVNYVGKLTDGSTFDSNQNIEFPLSAMIEGWKEGIPKFSRGGSGYLFIPSSLGYGPNGSGSIPGDAVLIFEIDLIDF